MIPVVLWLLIVAYGILIVGVITEKNIFQVFGGFLLMILAIEIIINGIGPLNNLLTLGIGYISIGFGAFHAIKIITEIDFSNKSREEE